MNARRHFANFSLFNYTVVCLLLRVNILAYFCMVLLLFYVKFFLEINLSLLIKLCIKIIYLIGFQILLQ